VATQVNEFSGEVVLERKEHPDLKALRESRFAKLEAAYDQGEEGGVGGAAAAAAAPRSASAAAAAASARTPEDAALARVEEMRRSPVGLQMVAPATIINRMRIFFRKRCASKFDES